MLLLSDCCKCLRFREVISIQVSVGSLFCHMLVVTLLTKNVHGSASVIFYDSEVSSQCAVNRNMSWLILLMFTLLVFSFT